jgi:SAM-dependent methyltransferase
VPRVAEPARWGSRRRLLDRLDALHLARPAVRAYELALAARSAVSPREAPLATDVPLPPTRLRVQVGPLHADPDFFLRSGEDDAGLIRVLLEKHGSTVEGLGAVLDFGCGCGRVLRHWSSLPGTRVYGCDINPKMVEWCKRNLRFAEVALTNLSPPLPYESESLGLVYAFSVFTHLSEGLQHAWIDECFRVLEPGAYLLLSTLGEHYVSLDRLTESERRSFSDGNLVVLYEGSPGTSLCSAYHPLEYVSARLAPEYEHVDSLPAADDGHHDVHLFRKPRPDGD